MKSTWSTFCAVAFPISAVLLCGCSPEARDQASGPGGATVPPSTSTKAKASGTVLLRLEKVGILIEGFRLQVRLEAPPERPVISSTWDELVHEQEAKPSMDEFYESVIRTSVPAGPFVLRTVMHPGMESVQPECVTRGQVEPGATVTVTVKFWVKDGCATVAGGQKA